MEKLRCPECHREMVDVRVRTIPLYQCFLCSGVWCDCQGLATLLNFEASQISALLEPSLSPLQRIGEGTFPCPVCSKPMDTFLYEPISAITMSSCHFRHGIWLGGEEVRGVREYMQEKKTSERLRHPSPLHQSLEWELSSTWELPAFFLSLFLVGPKHPVSRAILSFLTSQLITTWSDHFSPKRQP